jgi:DNA mismatch repair protein MSH5
MAVDMRHRDTVGCCYFVAQDERLYFMEDVQLGGADIVDACESPKQCRPDLPELMAVVKTYIDPTIVLISTSTDDAVLDRLDPEGSSGTSVNGESKRAHQHYVAGLM